MTEYRIHLYSNTGTLLAVFDNWRSLTMEKRLNSFSTHTLSMDARDPRAWLFELDGFVEVWRRAPEHNLDWYIEYSGFHRTPQYDISADGYEIFTSYGRSYEDLLKRSSLLWRAPYEKGPAPGDDIIKEFVYENCGAGATIANGRTRDHVYPGFVVAPNDGLCATWQGQRSWKNLLEVVQEIALASDCDFAVTRSGTTFTFNTYFPQYGVDRTESSGAIPRVFSTEFGNVTGPTHVHSRTEEVTVVSVQGSGEGVLRNIRVVDSATATESPYNDIELARDARNEDTDEAMDAVGRAELERNGGGVNFTFNVLETPSSVYGRDYAVGDLVTAQMRIRDRNNVHHLLTFDKKITEVSITVSEGQEQINFKFGDLEPLNAQAAIIGNITRRLRDIENSGEI